MNRNDALLAAYPMAAELSSCCERLQFAGSLRRLAPEVNDIEIVAIPRIAVERNLLDEIVAEYLLLDDWIADFVQGGVISVSKNGPRWKQFTLLPDGPKFDLFLVRPPAQWGVILALRTGPADYSKWLVSHQPFGACPPGLRFEAGGIYRNDVLIPTPEEAALFDLLGQPLLPPEERKVP